MGVGARVWCKHAAADKQIMLSLCCHGWQHTQRGTSALPGRRVHPFSQGGGEGEHEGGWCGGEAWSLSSLDHRHLRPSWQECIQPLWEERGRRKEEEEEEETSRHKEGK